jgi:hypothetical protein
VDEVAWRNLIARMVESLAPTKAPGWPDDSLTALNRELAACATAEDITADARLAAWRRSHG